MKSVEKIKLKKRIISYCVTMKDVTKEIICAGRKTLSEIIRVPVPVGLSVYNYRADTTLISADSDLLTADYY